MSGPQCSKVKSCSLPPTVLEAPKGNMPLCEQTRQLNVSGLRSLSFHSEHWAQVLYELDSKLRVFPFRGPVRLPYVIPCITPLRGVDYGSYGLMVSIGPIPALGFVLRGRWVVVSFRPRVMLLSRRHHT